MKKYKIILAINVTRKTYEKIEKQCHMSAFDCKTPGELFRFMANHKFKGINENITTELVSEDLFNPTPDL